MEKSGTLHTAAISLAPQQETARHAFRICFAAGVFVLAAAVLAIFLKILARNDGTFTYLLDDAYIHLSLAENIARGTYGINPGEAAATASSILWPFLLTPFAGWEGFPLVLNLLSAVGFVYFVSRILVESIRIRQPAWQAAVTSLLLVLVILSSNLIPIIFMGMEHGLQLMVVAWIMWELVRSITHNEVRNRLYYALFLAPLIRYENGVVVLAVMILLILQGQYRKSIFTSLAIAAAMAGFSIFLVSQGQPWLPASVLAKAAIATHSAGLSPVFANLAANLKTYFGVWAAIGAAAMVVFALFARAERKKRALAGSAFLVILLHLTFGGLRLGRYEGYSWLFLLLAGIFLSGGLVSNWINRGNPARRAVISSAGAALVLLIPAIPHLFLLASTPAASQNIYSQQYQMHRFVTEYYRAPVAVNDIGYVSYKNEAYVLDLWGLASGEALKSRKNESSSDWMSALAEAHKVELAMIYRDWFEWVPAGWIELGTLKLSAERITAAGDEVTFYAANAAAREEINVLLQKFIPTLPASAQFEFSD